MMLRTVTSARWYQAGTYTACCTCQSASVDELMYLTCCWKTWSRSSLVDSGQRLVCLWSITSFLMCLSTFISILILSECCLFLVFDSTLTHFHFHSHFLNRLVTFFKWVLRRIIDNHSEQLPRAVLLDCTVGHEKSIQGLHQDISRVKPCARDFETGEFMWIVVNMFIPLHPYSLQTIDINRRTWRRHWSAPHFTACVSLLSTKSRMTMPTTFTQSVSSYLWPEHLMLRGTRDVWNLNLKKKRP